MGREKRAPGRKTMTCVEFQRVLPFIIETGGNAEEESHLQTCAICKDLVDDLRYIADQAKLLVPMEDPNPRVWEEIQKSVEQEGLVKTGTLRKGLPGRSSLLWLVPMAAALVTTAMHFGLE